ncbi:MAG: glycoside hydrolase family 5 protein [Actinomycetota bacterium]
MRRAVTMAILTAALLAPGSAVGRELGSSDRLPALHAEPDPVNGGRIVDAEGREVLLRGVNVNALAEYWEGTDFRTTFPLKKSDPARMASIGWNAVRLLLSWSKVEPEPGEYDEEYLGRVAKTVDRLADVGIYTIIDLHQDAWGATLAGSPDERCEPPQTPALGWDGAPEWATLDGGAARCWSGIRELSPAVTASWTAFFADTPASDGVGVRTHYVEMLGHVAERFADESAVAGYDLMNEPNAFSDEHQAALSAMYGEALAAIRAAEEAGDGFPHLVLFEPAAVWSSTGRGAPPDFPRDENVVYAPHLYTGGFTNGPITAEAFTIAKEEAGDFGGAPVLSGEWGSGPERAGPAGDGYFVEHQRLQDEFRISATLWTWRESCGDPHKAADIRAGEVPEVWGEFEVDCTDNSIVGVRADLVTDLTRGYVRAAPGRLTATTFDPATGTLIAAGEAGSGRAPLVAFHPGPRTKDAEVTVDGLAEPKIEELEGGGLVIRAKPKGGAWELRVEPVNAGK